MKTLLAWLLVSASCLAAGPIPGMWSPKCITGLKIYYDPAIQSTASQLTDLSGNGLNATQTTNAYQAAIVTNVFNGQPVIRTTGSSSNHYNFTPTLIGTTATCVVATKCTSSTTQLSWVTFGDGPTTNRQIASSRTDNGNYIWYDGTHFTVTGTYNLNAAIILTEGILTAGSLSVNTNTVNAGSGSGFTTITIQSVFFDGLNGSGFVFPTADFGPIILTTTAMSTAAGSQLQLLRAWYNARYHIY